MRIKFITFLLFFGLFIWLFSDGDESKILKPSNIKISVFDEDIVVLQWDHVYNADKYYIYGGNDPYTEKVLIDSTTSNVSCIPEALYL
ncbi:MAG: hypothetical protein KKD38_03775 [Candidatus Delongbacteria bacterium]|nr:hypothetical protein [Candidatus Delongbacteria bacterium]MCG2759860.1 hypothetical protein [Candidatus Delongbacteria bacterium]